jgi:hypothetical protein
VSWEPALSSVKFHIFGIEEEYAECHRDKAFLLLRSVPVIAPLWRPNESSMTASALLLKNASNSRRKET